MSLKRPIRRQPGAIRQFWDIFFSAPLLSCFVQQLFVNSRRQRAFEQNNASLGCSQCHICVVNPNYIIKDHDQLLDLAYILATNMHGLTEVDEAISSFISF